MTNNDDSLVPNRDRPIRRWGFLLLAAGLLIYLVLIPVYLSLRGWLEAKTKYRFTYGGLSFFDLLKVQSAKFFVFGVVVAIGASIGSFLNVLVLSAPRRQPLLFRQSRCPGCQKPIRGIDNIPIFSYLWLNGRCRNCQMEIPIEYLIGEVLTAGIFAYLFLIQLVQGGSNLPSLISYDHPGIADLVLSTDWELVGLTAYHALLFCSLLVLILIDIHRTLAPIWLLWLMTAFIGVTPIVYPTLLPVSLMAGLQPNPNLRSIGLQLSQLLAGACMGNLIASSTFHLNNGQRRHWMMVWILMGLGLGWQALLMISLLFFLSLPFALYLYSFTKSEQRQNFPTLICLWLVAMIHHAFWRWFFDRAREVFQSVS